MKPETKSGRCLSVLRDGPATTGEVAAETGLSSHDVGNHMHCMFQRGKVTREPFMVAPRQGVPGRRKCWLWSAA